MTPKASITIEDAPAGFVGRPEFQPRGGPRGAGGARDWLPLDPFFRQDPEGFLLEARSPLALRGGERAAIVRGVLARWAIAPGDRARENLRRLEDDRTRLVITGQQPGLLSGPLHTPWKAAAAVAAAIHLERRTGIAHVPIFWVHSEDHDFDEVRAVRFPGKGGAEGETVELRLPHAADRRPLSAYKVDGEFERVLEEAKALLSTRRRGAAAAELVDLYRGRDLAGGFAAILLRLFEPHGLLAVEPESLRSAGRPIVRRCLEEPAELLQRLLEGVRRVEAAGVPAQVPPRFPLFLLADGKRHHLSPEAGPEGGVRFRLDGVGGEFSQGELLDLLERDPSRFSSGALLRPAVQNALLPNAVYLGGPAEAAYFAQLPPLFDWLGLPPPRIALRLSASLIEGKIARAIRRLGLAPGDPGASTAWALASGPADLLPPLAEGPEAAYRSLAEEITPRLLAPLEDPRLVAADRERLRASADKLVEDLRGLGARAARAARQGETEDLAAAARILAHLFPGGAPQERRWNILHYVSKYGVEWLDSLVEAAAADPFRPAHRWGTFGGGPTVEEER